MIKRNIFANLAGRAWGFISVYLFVPLYLKYLGVEAYGLVGFYSTLLGVLAFADLGFSATLNREMARLSAAKDDAAMRDLLRTYEVSYLWISGILAVGVFLAAPLISERWLQSSTLPPEEIATAIRIMGISIALQLPAGLYVGGLMGLQMQVRANSVQVAWGVYRGGGAVLALMFVSPTILSFAVWQLISNAVYCYSCRHSLWQLVPADRDRPPARFRRSVFMSSWRYASGMTGMGLLSVILTQVDKLAVSKMLSLEMLGFYSIAGALAAVPLMAASPVAAAIFPRFTELVALGDFATLRRLYHKTSELVALTVIPAGLVLVFFAHETVLAWTGSTVTATNTALAATLLLGGQLLQALTLVPYYVALAHGNIRLNLRVGVASAVLVTPLLIVLVRQFGLVGAGLSWLIMNVATFGPYMYFFHRSLLPGEFARWLKSSVVLPVVTAAPCVFLFWQAMPEINSRLFILAYLGCAWLVAVLATAAIMPAVRAFIGLKAVHYFGYLRG